MRLDDMDVLFDAIEDVEEEYELFIEHRKYYGRKEITLEEYLLYRGQALDMLRMENSNGGDPFTLPRRY